MRSVAVLLAMVLTVQLVTVVFWPGDGEAPPAESARVEGTTPVVSDKLLTEGRVLQATVLKDTFSPPAHVVYGEPGLADPLTGRMLVVGSAFSAALPVVPTSETGGFRLVELPGRTVAVGHDRAWTWVTWKLPDCTEVCQGYAAGRNLSEGDVVEAARSATVDRNAPTVAAVPAGLSPLVSLRLDLQNLAAPGAQSVSWLWDGTTVGLVVVPDTRMALLLRFWVDGGPVHVRRGAGSDGELARVAFGRDLVARAWSEGGRSLLVVSDRILHDDLDRFVAGLRVARGHEWDVLRSRVLEASSEGLIDPCRAAGGSYSAVGRQEGRYRWAVGFGPGQAACQVVLTPDRSALSAGGVPPPAPRSVSVATSRVSGATDPAGVFVVGVAPAGTTRIRLDTADGRQLDAELSADGPGPGERYYASFVEGAVRARPTVVALNGAGGEIARAAGGAPL